MGFHPSFVRGEVRAAVAAVFLGVCMIACSGEVGGVGGVGHGHGSSTAPVQRAPETVNHFTVLARNPDQTRSFYVEILGLTEGPRPALGFPGAWLYAGGRPCCT